MRWEMNMKRNETEILKEETRNLLTEVRYIFSSWRKRVKY
jgi:hypothetical protein